MVMNDSEILSRINELVGEEQAILDRQGEAEAHAGDSKRREELEATLDQCWDLLRQRRAYRESGRDPDLLTVRSKRMVEGYEQ